MKLLGNRSWNSRFARGRHEDAESDAVYLVDKIVNLRILTTSPAKMNRSLMDIGGGLWPFAIHALRRRTKGRRPSYPPPRRRRGKRFPLRVFIAESLSRSRMSRPDALGDDGCRARKRWTVTIILDSLQENMKAAVYHWPGSLASCGGQGSIKSKILVECRGEKRRGAGRRHDVAVIEMETRRLWHDQDGAIFEYRARRCPFQGACPRGF